MRDESESRVGARVSVEHAGKWVGGACTGVGLEVRTRSVAHGVGWISPLVDWSR
jgi:hypothetical protein